MKTRFAPSPTGYLHIGNIRTALFNALLAYREQGSFVLRIEDTDRLRSTAEFADALQEDLRWLGLSHHKEQASEAVVFQSQRNNIYAHYYDLLEKAGSAYPCFCTEARLEALREKQRLQHQSPGYDGKCRELSKELIQHKKQQGEAYHLRFRVPEHKKIHFVDLVKADQRFDSNTLHDFVIQRTNRSPAFLYCNALDDALMGITHVLRGEDHLSNTAKQILLLEALNLPIPQYGHLPLITLQDSTLPLSKREGSFSLRALQAQGYLPIAIINYLVRLGHTVESPHLMSLKELTPHFSINHIHTASARFDNAQLQFWQKKAIQNQSTEAFWVSLDQDTQRIIPLSVKARFINIMQSMVLFPLEAKEWSQLLFIDSLNYSEEAKQAIRAADSKLWFDIAQLIQSQGIDSPELQKDIKQYLNNFEGAARKTHWKALRAALTNRLAGPELIDIIQLMGKTRVCQRLHNGSLVR